MRVFLYEIRERTKELIKRPYIRMAIITFFVSLASFSIGYIFGRERYTHPIVITPCGSHATMGAIHE